MLGHHAVARFNPSQLTKIIFDYPADSGFVAERIDAGWMVAGLLADSASMASYVNGISQKSHSDYLDGFKPEAEPDIIVSLEGDNMVSQHLRAYINNDRVLILNCSINPDSWFQITREGLFKDLFPGSSAFF